MTPQPAATVDGRSVDVTLIERLQAEFPDLTDEAVGNAVRRSAEEFADARIDAYLAILVERSARRLLRARHERAELAGA